MSRIKGVCIKSYQDEGDLQEFEEGTISADEIRVYEIGQEDSIVDGFYDKQFWKPKN